MRHHGRHGPEMCAPFTSPAIVSDVIIFSVFILSGVSSSSCLHIIIICCGGCEKCDVIVHNEKSSAMSS